MTDAEKLAAIHQIIRNCYGCQQRRPVLEQIEDVLRAAPEPKKPPQTPGDKLAHLVEVVFRAMDYNGDSPAQRRALREALDEYRSTRNVRLVPDPKTLARDLLDTLTGEALSGLIAIVRDDLSVSSAGCIGVTEEIHTATGVKRKLPAYITPAGWENLRAHLRALGEDLP